ncbi:hypothetical protein UPYG_G00155990 [Umbra pygmaea]|uniref:Uncharacterized protein n=1 Tax=Umbra pygmaea TaxID=75934 RepID=A0ABD0WY76_UMBPY
MQRPAGGWCVRCICRSPRPSFTLGFPSCKYKGTLSQFHSRARAQLCAPADAKASPFQPTVTCFNTSRTVTGRPAVKVKYDGREWTGRSGNLPTT